jgi:hypothetical protein
MTEEQHERIVLRSIEPKAHQLGHYTDDQGRQWTKLSGHEPRACAICGVEYLSGYQCWEHQQPTRFVCEEHVTMVYQQVSEQE